MDIALVSNRDEQQQLARLESRPQKPGHGGRHWHRPLFFEISNSIWLSRELRFVMYPFGRQNRMALVEACLAFTGYPFDMRLIQFLDPGNRPRVGVIHVSGEQVATLRDFTSTYDLAQAAIADESTIEELVRLERARRRATLRAAARRRTRPAAADPCRSDSLPRFGHGADAPRQRQLARCDARQGEGGGRRESRSPIRCACSSGASRAAGPAAGEAGAQPEWFYKGNGRIVVGCGAPIVAPDFALDYGEEPELVGLYVIAARRHARAARLRDRQRVLRSRDRAAATISISRIRSCVSAPSGRSCAPARCRSTWKA